MSDQVPDTMTPDDLARERKLRDELEEAQTNELMVARQALLNVISYNFAYQRPDLEALLIGWSALHDVSEAREADYDEVWQARHEKEQRQAQEASP